MPAGSWIRPMHNGVSCICCHPGYYKELHLDPGRVYRLGPLSTFFSADILGHRFLVGDVRVISALEALAMAVDD